eukprot:CFRG6636T1
MSSPSFIASLLAGGIAGTSVDLALFPLDTIKTRLQSAEGFSKSGGFTGVYRGLTSVVVGSAPGAALFFSTYEMSKKTLSTRVPEKYAPITHMASAINGEVMACLVRVPCELIKQIMQTNAGSTAASTARNIIQRNGITGLWRGYSSTIVREVPFSIIQFPLYEAFRGIIARAQDSPVEPWQGACCGSLAGGISGAITTPLDVVKTRIMLCKGINGTTAYTTISGTFTRILQEEGPRKLYAGVVPRTMWITIGGFVFFGVYETGKKYLAPVFP